MSGSFEKRSEGGGARTHDLGIKSHSQVHAPSLFPFACMLLLRHLAATLVFPRIAQVVSVPLGLHTNVHTASTWLKTSATPPSSMLVVSAAGQHGAYRSRRPEF
jgi:hypothetical protein